MILKSFWESLDYPFLRLMSRQIRPYVSRHSDITTLYFNLILFQLLLSDLKRSDFDLSQTSKWLIRPSLLLRSWPDPTCRLPVSYKRTSGTRESRCPGESRLEVSSLYPSEGGTYWGSKVNSWVLVSPRKRSVVVSPSIEGSLPSCKTYWWNGGTVGKSPQLETASSNKSLNLEQVKRFSWFSTGKIPSRLTFRQSLINLLLKGVLWTLTLQPSVRLTPRAYKDSVVVLFPCRPSLY